MSNPSSPDDFAPAARWDRLICVDWGKELGKRAASVADVATRTISPLDVDPTVSSLVTYAATLPGRTLIGIDAALGIPRLYLSAARIAVPAQADTETFLAWLTKSVAVEGFTIPATTASEWRHDRPFIAVPAGRGSLQAFWRQAGTVLRRRVDLATGGNSPFVVSGIPGSVGSGSRALWLELAAQPTSTRSFGLWPFDGGPALSARRVVMGEMYPRACYALALSASLPTLARSIGKSKEPRRHAAVDELSRTPWLRKLGVTIEAQALVRARESEDHFDAVMAAAGLLRCLLEGRSLSDPHADLVEGGIFGLSAILPRASSRGRSVRTIENG